MKSIFTIAQMTLKLIFKNGTGWGILAFLLIIPTVVFYISHGDGSLFNELQIRSQYAWWVTIALMGPILLFLSCTILSSDIEGRQLHMMDATPTPRYVVFLGRGLGIWFFSCIALGVSVFVISLAVEFKGRGNLTDSGVDEYAKFKESWTIVYPEWGNIEAAVESELLKIQQSGAALEANSATVRNELREKCRRVVQTVSGNSSKSWDFHWHGYQKGMTAKLFFKFVTAQRSQGVQLKWSLSGEDSSLNLWKKSMIAYPYLPYELPISSEFVPVGDQKISLKIQSMNKDALIFPNQTGLYLAYQDSHLLWNLLKSMGVAMIWFATVISMGLAASSFFTYTVSTFSSLSIYGIGFLTPFLETVTRDWMYVEGGGSAFFYHLVRYGILMTKALQPPESISWITQSRTFHFADLSEWLVYTGITLLMMIFLGIIALWKKELDRHSISA